MKKSHLLVTILLIILGVLCFVFFDALHLSILEDTVADKLLRGILSRTGIALPFGWLLYITGGRRFYTFNKRFFRLLIWSFPCFVVAFVNFPYSALIRGTAQIVRYDLIWLFALYALSIAILEELIFRGVLFLLAKDYLKNYKHAPLLVVLVCSILFGIFHLTNLFSGSANVGLVFLQVGYTFLIGAMLTTTMLKLNNIWLCILIHAIFNFGGQIVEYIGDKSSPWDATFWILTISCGVLCAGHVIYSLIKMDRYHHVL